jgi:DNA-binding CsgD family transcriptional regulator
LNTDQILLDQLQRRWKATLDITTVAQAQSALNLPANLSQRLRIHKTLTADPRLWKAIKACGARPLTVTLTELEKRFARKLAAGETAADVASQLDMSASDVRAARRALAAVGLLRRGRIVADAGRLLGDLGLQSHTVRVEGEPAFNVP